MTISVAVAIQSGTWTARRSLGADADAARRSSLKLLRNPRGLLDELRRLPNRGGERPAPATASRMCAGGPQLLLDPGSHNGLRGAPHIDVRIERAAHAFDHDHGLLQQQKLGPHAHLEQAGHFEELGSRAAPSRSRAAGRPMDRLADGPQRLREGRNVLGRGHIATSK